MTDVNIAVIRIKDILLATLAPEPDDNLVGEMQNHILQAMYENPAKGVILNISMVEIVDSFFARTMAETAQMVALMGGKTVIAGMRPNVAIISTQLGFIMGNVQTALDVDSALELLN